MIGGIGRGGLLDEPAGLLERFRAAGLVVQDAVPAFAGLYP
jgi:hypothetical protein